MELTDTPRKAHTFMSARARAIMWGLGACLLCIPLIAMQFTSEVNWSPADFLIFAGMLIILGGAIEAAMKYPAQRKWRATAIAISLVIFFAVWAELAVGIFE